MATIERKALKRAISLARRATDKRGSIPILGCIALEPSGPALHVRATDIETELELECRFEGAPLSAGGAFRADALAALTKSGPDRLDLEVIDTPGGPRLQLAGATLLGEPLEEFPKCGRDLEGVGETPRDHETIPAADLRRALAATLPSASTDKTRYNLAGVYLEDAGRGVVWFVATNGHRLARHRLPGTYALPWGRDDGKPEGRILPGRAGELTLAALGRKPQGVAVLARVGTTLRVGFELPGVGYATVRAREVNGEFPNYRVVLPQPGRSWVVTSTELEEAVRHVLPLAAGRSAAVRFHATAEELELFTKDPDLGEAYAKIACVSTGTTEPLSWAFNARYVLDTIAAVTDGETMELTLTASAVKRDTNLSAFEFSSTRSTTRVVVMPMRL